MTELQTIVIDRISQSTANVVDRYRNLAALLYARSQGIEKEGLEFILAKRLGWLNSLTMTQRKWQSETRNANKAHHHDSIQIRENYVRCHDAYSEKLRAIAVKQIR